MAVRTAALPQVDQSCLRPPGGLEPPEPKVRQLAGGRLGHVPKTFTTLAVPDLLSSRDVHCQQVPNTFAKRFNGEAIDGLARHLTQPFAGFHPALGRPRGIALSSKVVLIDGLKLSQLLIDFDVGVSTAQTYTIKRIDTDYFEAE